MVAKSKGRQRPRAFPHAGFAAQGLRHPVFLEHFQACSKLRFRPRSSSSSPSVLPSGPGRPRDRTRGERAVRDLSAGFGREAELASSLDPAEVTARVLAAVAALPGADAALLLLDGRAVAVGLSDQEVERAAHETPPNTNLRSMEVVYRYRLDEVDGSNLPRAALVVPLRTGDGTIRLALGRHARESAGLPAPKPPTRSKRSGSGRAQRFGTRSASPRPSQLARARLPHRASQPARSSNELLGREVPALAPLRPPPRPIVRSTSTTSKRNQRPRRPPRGDTVLARWRRASAAASARRTSAAASGATSSP